MKELYRSLKQEWQEEEPMVRKAVKFYLLAIVPVTLLSVWVM